MPIEKVRKFLSENGKEDRIIEFDVSSATVALAARALGTDACRIAKSMAFYVGDEVVLIVCAGDVKIDNRKFKDAFGVKAKMIPHEKTEEEIGHGAGGICPFALNAGVRVFVDRSILRFDTVYPAAGSSNSCVRLTPEELFDLCPGAVWGDYTKPIEGVE